MIKEENSEISHTNSLLSSRLIPHTYQIKEITEYPNSICNNSKSRSFENNSGQINQLKKTDF